MSSLKIAAGRLTVTRLFAAAVVAVSIVLGIVHRPVPLTIGDYLYYLFLAANAGFALALFVQEGSEASASGRSSRYLLFRPPEILLAVGVVLFLFVFIYATNANMSYVQRFQATHGNIHLAPDSRRERLAAGVQYLPLLALDAFWYVYYRVRVPRPRRSTLSTAGRTGAWALAASVVSAILYAFAFPSFVRNVGLPFLSYVALVPLFLAVGESSLGWGVFYGTFFGVVQTLISNYWLGTFDLLSLQFVTIVTLLEYVPFMVVSLLALRWSGGLGFLVFPAAWTAFDWVRSQGFLGYPWGMLGASQYSVLPMIQIASVTGVWGVTSLVVLCNSVIAWYLGGRWRERGDGNAPGVSARLAPAIVVVSALVVTLGWAEYGSVRPRIAGSAPTHVRLALIEQDSDPRKDNYDDTFRTLQDLTNQAMVQRPDLVVWSETAFVPNIRRWSTEDPNVYPLAALVKRFLAYQKSLGDWLITGNDDYTLIESAEGEERLDYNGSVLFSPDGERVETYHKIHLVPFTEYFPYKKQLPQVYHLLQSFDAYLWEPGDRRVVFRHPRFSFSTPICFEDVFPNDVRLFVVAGAQVIINLSNDYWSLTDTEAMQHAANAVFRAVENGVPLARASASGLTCLVSPRGRIVARGPFYEPSYLIVDVPLAPHRETVYTRWGDWFPVALLIGLVLMPVIVLIIARLRREPERDRG